MSKLENVKVDCFTIKDYFDSWQMRKEIPQIIVDNLYDALSGVNHTEKLKALFITINYFFNDKIKELGKELVSVKVSQSMLEIIDEIQKQIQHEVKSKGINIEIWPSLNVIIGSVEGYVYHLIFNIYSEGLTSRNKQVNSTQIPVSINTDDQSIFGTSLKNEY